MKQTQAVIEQLKYQIKFHFKMKNRTLCRARIAMLRKITQKPIVSEVH